jgi:dihydrodipicolinate reductase
MFIVLFAVSYGTVLQVVAFQQMMQIMADQFPGAFSGYKLSVVESHQRNKADTSGTAKAVVQSFAKMGVDFKEVSEAMAMLCAADPVGGLSCVLCQVTCSCSRV